MADSDSDEIEYAKEQQIINNTFGEWANGVICISSKELDTIISTEKDIIIKNTYGCYCYSEAQRPHDYFHIRSNQPHTNKTIIKHLIKNNFNPGCNHMFLEKISKINDTSYQLFMGS
jgi:hypothetical protein